MRIPYVSLLAAGALSLGGCADYYGYGGGLGYNGYYGDYGPAYGSPYYGGGYSSGYGYGSPYYGWYDDVYYPGTGVYVYDTYRRPHTMTTRQRSYWSSRSPTTSANSNWSGFNRRGGRHY